MIAAAVLAALILAAAAVAVQRSTDLLIRQQQRRQVVIELQSGQTFRGLLVKADAKTLLLRSVESLASEQAAPIVIDGELLVPRSDVKYLQRP